MMKKFKGERY